MVLLGILLAAWLAAPAAQAALTDDSKPLALAAVQYGRDHLDPTSGLVRDASGLPSVAEASVGFAAASLILGEETAAGRGVLEKILDTQQTGGPEAGHFPWTGGAGSKTSAQAVIYMAPLLAAIYRDGKANLDEPLRARLQASLRLAAQAVGRLSYQPSDDALYLLRAAARESLAVCLGERSGNAGEVTPWLDMVRTTGLPQGHSPTLDAVRLVALKWINDMLPEPARPRFAPALLLTAVDLAERLQLDLPGLAGAQTAAFPADYLAAPGFASYVLHTDFGGPRPVQVEPYIMAALLPSWRAPAAVRTLVEQPVPRLARTTSTGNVQATATYVGPGFSLGTQRGAVAEATIPVLATFAGQARRASTYFFCQPAPCHVQAVQQDATALVSFNFDRIGQGTRRQASVEGILGRAEDVEEVQCYGVPWDGVPTSLGERESVAVAMHGCYLGVILTRVGPAASQEGPPAKPATLRWTGEGRTGDLTLTVYARKADYALRVPENDVRAGFIIEIAPKAAYLSLTDFVKHLNAGRFKQSVRTFRVRVPEQEKAREPGVIIPKPVSKIDRVYRDFIEQTTEYVNGERSLKLVEDLKGEATLQAFVDGKELKTTDLWSGPGFTLAPNGDLAAALQIFTQP